MGPAAKKPRGPSAYMIFSEGNRASVTERLRAEAPDGKVPITAIAKSLGELWKSLPDEEKASFKDQAQQRAAAAAEAAAAAAEGEDATDAAAQQACDAASPAGLPRHVVKKLIMTDPDVQRVAADAVWLLAEAAGLFLHQLAVKGATAAAAKKRKTVKLEDFEHLVRCDRRLVEAGMKDIVNNKSLFEQQGPAAAAAGAVSSRKQLDGCSAAAEEGQQQGDNTAQAAEMTDEQRIMQEEMRQKKAAEAAKARAAKATEKKKAKQAAQAASTHKITTFFVSNKPETLV